MDLGEGHKENNSMENFNNLQIWQSNIPAAIEHAVENKCLTESLVAMSPLGMFIILYFREIFKQNLFNFNHSQWPVLFLTMCF